MTDHLFSAVRIRDIDFKNRIFVSPMCQYSSNQGMPTAWHLVHSGSRAVGGAACVIQEATAVCPEGRISPSDAGIWNDLQTEAYKPITSFIKDHGAIPGIQIAHAGRKASVAAPWDGGKSISAKSGGWEIKGPSPLSFDESSAIPTELSLEQIKSVVTHFVEAARRSLKAGFEVIELHAAHGYLIHEFLSPLSNHRQDIYGGSLENRMRLCLEVAQNVRALWPDTLPMFVRISASDWTEGGWDIDQSIILSKELKSLGVDLIDVSSGGNVPHAKIPIGPGYQVPFAAQIKQQAQIATGAVGMITDAIQANMIISKGEADIVLLAREFLRDPYWPLHAAEILGVEMAWPKQYERAKLTKNK